MTARHLRVVDDPGADALHDPAVMFATEMFEQAREMTDPVVLVMMKRAEKAMGKLADAIQVVLDSGAVEA